MTVRVSTRINLYNNPINNNINNNIARAEHVIRSLSAPQEPEYCSDVRVDKNKRPTVTSCQHLLSPTETLYRAAGLSH